MGGGGGYVLSRAALDKFIKIQDDPRTDTQVGCDRRSNLEGEDPAMGIQTHMCALCIMYIENI